MGGAFKKILQTKSMSKQAQQQKAMIHCSSAVKMRESEDKYCFLFEAPAQCLGVSERQLPWPVA